MRKITVLFVIFILLLAGCSQETKNTFKITLDPNYEGGQSEEITTDVNGVAQMPLIPNGGNRQGYTKLGWADSATAKTAKYLPMSSYSFSSSVTLYSVWEPKAYSITYFYNNGTNDKTTRPFTVEDNVSALDIGDISYEGYSFVGWCEKSDGTGKVYSSGDVLTFSDNVTLYGIWSVNTYYVEYDANGGNGTIPKASYYGYQDATIETASRLSREGYTFEGWNTEADGTGTNYEANETYYGRESIKLYAKWKERKKFTVTYDLNGADGGVVPSSREVYEENSIIVPGQGSLTKANYTFIGWNTESDSSGRIYRENDSFNITKNVTLYAMWRENEIFKIVYNSNGGEGAVSELSVHVGEEFTLDDGEALSKQDYQFVKWNTKADGKGTDFLPGVSYTATKNMTLYAQWKYLYEGLTFTFNSAYGRYDVSASDTSISTVNIPVKYKNFDVAIAKNGFKGCSNLVSLVIPTGLKQIGEDAFSDSGLKTVSIPEGVESLSEDMFFACKKLETIAIPSSLKSLGKSVFQACPKLTTINLENTSIKEIPYQCFCACTTLQSVTFPDSLTSIGDGAFGNCQNLVISEIPESVESIGIRAFYQCYSIESLRLPPNLTEIKENTFRSCTKLVSLVIPSKVTSIGDSAFIYCTSLTTIDIPAATISVGSSAFSNCTSLKTIKYGGTMAKARSLFTSTAGVSSGVTVVCADGSYTKT